MFFYDLTSSLMIDSVAIIALLVTILLPALSKISTDRPKITTFVSSVNLGNFTLWQNP
jgi:hypothetical protein